MQSLSVKAKLHKSTISSYFTKGASPSIDNFITICKELGVKPSQILDDAETYTPSIPVVGVVSAGEGWTPLDQDQTETVEFEVGRSDTIAVDVRGDSMSPVYRDGDKLICQRFFGPYADNLINRDCVIQTADGRHYVKILKRGTKPNRFNLKSYNPLVDDIEDVSIAWAAPVVWVKRG